MVLEHFNPHVEIQIVKMSIIAKEENRNPIAVKEMEPASNVINVYHIIQVLNKILKELQTQISVLVVQELPINNVEIIQLTTRWHQTPILLPTR